MLCYTLTISQKEAFYTEDLTAVRQRYESTINELTEKLKRTGEVVAVILNGSLSYDVVWEKSDVDMVIVVNDQKLVSHGFCIDCDGINVNIDIMLRSSFRRNVEYDMGGSISHSFLAKGKVLYTSDETLREFFEESKHIGEDDMATSLCFMSGELICTLEKTHKWLEVKHNLTYAQYYVLKMSEQAARLTVCRACEPPTREAVLRALQLEPELYEKIYLRPLQGPMSYEELEDCCTAVDAYLTGMIEVMSKPIKDYMSDGQIRTLNTLSGFFKCESHYFVHILDYFAEKGAIQRLTQTIKIIPKSKKEYEEVAYICL